MYDLCSRSEQPKPASATADMGSRGDGEAAERPQQEPKKKAEADERRGTSNGDVTTAVKNTSLLGKRHHSLYANLNGFEVEDKHKVSVSQFLLACDHNEPGCLEPPSLIRFSPELQKDQTVQKSTEGSSLLRLLNIQAQLELLVFCINYVRRSLIG